MITAFPSHRRRALLALTAAATLIGAAALAGVTAPAALASAGAGGADSLTISPNHGPVSDLTHAPANTGSDPGPQLAPGQGNYTLDAAFSCDGNAGAARQAALFVSAGTFDAAPSVPSGGASIQDLLPNALWNPNMLLSDSNPYNFVPSAEIFPGSMTDPISTFTSGWGTPAADVGAFIAEPGVYTVGISCLDSNLNVFADASGHAVMSWATLTVDASHNWSMSTGGGSGPTKSDSAVAVAAALHAGSSTVDLTATVSKKGESAPAIDAAGTVQFFRDGGTAIAGGASVSVTNGVASFTTPDLSAGSHTFTAVYTPSGSAPYNVSAPSATSAAVTVPTTNPAKADPVVDLTGDPSGNDGIDLTATIQKADHTTAADASGTVEFWTDGADGKKVGEATASNGVATLHLDGQQAGADHAFVAKYVPGDAAAYNAAESASVTVTLPPIPMSDGDTLTIGQTYAVTFTATDFPAGDTVTGEVHSDPITLPGSATSGAQGGTFVFTVPTALGPGEQHQLVLTGTPSGNTKSYSFTTAGTAAGGGSGSTGTAATGSNDPVSFATDWIAANSGNPVAIGGLLAVVTLLLGAGVGGWFLFWSRRRRAQGVVEQG